MTEPEQHEPSEGDLFVGLSPKLKAELTKQLNERFSYKPEYRIMERLLACIEDEVLSSYEITISFSGQRVDKGRVIRNLTFTKIKRVK